MAVRPWHNQVHLPAAWGSCELLLCLFPAARQGFGHPVVTSPPRGDSRTVCGCPQRWEWGGQGSHDSGPKIL